VLGANVAAVLRALVACGWFGIQTWIGGEAISTLVATLAAGMEILSLLDGRLLSSFWLINLGSHSHGNRIHPNSARDQRTGTSGGRIAASSMGLSRRRRLRSMLAAPSRFTNFKDS